MHIEEIDINVPRFASYNSRTITQDVKEKLKKSIQEYGVYSPLIVNKRTFNTVGGNQRLMALRELGHETVYVVWVDLSLEKEKILNIQLNKISGEWDFEKLSQLLDELSKLPDFDIELTGFNLPEISQIFDRYGEQKDLDDFDFDAVVAAIKAPITRKGDIIELGVHRIMCGDSASENDLNMLMQNEKINLVQTDPPYGCLYLAQNRPDLESRPKKSKRWEKLYKDDLNEKEYEEWIKSVLKNMKRFLKDGASAYIWNGHAKFYFVHQILKELGFHVSTVITWAKPTFAISYGDFNQQTEFCLFSWLKNAPHKWYGPTNETNLWEINRDKSSELIHPTQKSVQIPARAIRNSSVRGDVVFDGFLGSGSTLIAAESLGRRCFGMEIEPKYCDAIVCRYINLVGRNKVSEEIVNRYTKEDRK
jgi:DNA modification methylase